MYVHIVLYARIFCEETAESHEDQQVVREISNEFPHLFRMWQLIPSSDQDLDEDDLQTLV